MKERERIFLLGFERFWLRANEQRANGELDSGITGCSLKVEAELYRYYLITKIS